MTRWLWLLPSLLILAAWGRSFLVCDAVVFRAGTIIWQIDTRDAARLNVTYASWPNGKGESDRRVARRNRVEFYRAYGLSELATVIREGHVDYFDFPVFDTKTTVQQYYFGNVYTTTLLLPFWA